MKTIGFVGNLGDKDAIGGQITKTRELLDAILEKKGVDCSYGKEYSKKKLKYHNVVLVNTNKHNKLFILLCNIVEVFHKSDCILIILSSNGYFRLLPIFSIINKVYKKTVFEFVIGGTRHELLNKRRIRYEKKLEKIYVESSFMVKRYQELGLNNVEYLPNFKRINPIDIKQIDNRDKNLIRLCTFSRIDQFKGIDSAIKIMNAILMQGYNVQLDIIGPVDKEYQSYFNDLLLKNNRGINYIGAINGSKAIEVLRNYDILLFPTKWKNEGFPGSFIDAMAAGLVVLASKRENFRDIIKNDINGYLIDENDLSMFVDKILYLIVSVDKLRLMQKNAIKESMAYDVNIVLENFFSKIEI